MPSRNLFADSKRDWNQLGVNIKKQAKKYMQQRVKKDLEDAVAGYDTDFPFFVYEEKRGNDIQFVCKVIPGVGFKRETDGEFIKAEDLFTWLDKGIEVSHVQFLSNPGKQGNTIIASKNINYENPYEPKRWTETINEKHRNVIPKLIRGVIKSFLSGTK